MIIRIAEILTALAASVYIIGNLIAFIWRWKQMRKWIPCLLLLAIPTITEAAGSEARCDELGANCVCSEPFLMTSFTQNVDTPYWNPTDTTTNECGYEVAGHPISRVAQDITVQTDATALERIGNAIPRFMSSSDDSAGIFFVGGDINAADLGATYNARMAVRFYTYYSPDYNFRDDTPACHSKFLQGSVGSWHLENFQGYIHMYDFFGANWGTTSGTYFPRDCCWTAPGAAITLDNADWQGHWFRVEVVTTNRSGPGWRTILYMKDVTTTGVTKVNGGEEFVAADTYSTDSGPDDWTTAFNQQITSSPRQLPMVANMYREVGAGECIGWRGISHFMMAGWDTDAGQRIGAASEIESGGGGGSPIVMFIEAAPIVTSMIWHFRQAIVSGFLACWMVGGALFTLTTQKTKQLSYTASVKTVESINRVLEKVNR